MRRALLVRGAPAGPVSIGNPAVIGSNFFNTSSRLLVDATTAATGTGTLTVANVYTETAGTIYVMTGTISGTNYTVRAISGALSASAGVNALGISLPAVAGDFIACYLPSGTGATVRFTSGGGTRGTSSSPGSPPVATDVLIFSSNAGTLSLGANN